MVSSIETEQWLLLDHEKSLGIASRMHVLKPANPESASFQLLMHKISVTVLHAKFIFLWAQFHFLELR